MLNYELYLNTNCNKYILLLHCICGDVTIFNKQLESLKKLYNIILIDLPYHGNSKIYNKELTFYNISSDIITILDKHNIQKVTIIGLSLGSCIANYLCYYYSDRIEKIIFTSAANGLSNILFKNLFSIFTKVNIFFPTNIYLKIFIYLIIPQKDNRYFRKIFYDNGKMIGKQNLRKYLKLLNEHFNNCNKYLIDYNNVNNIPKTYLMGEKDYVFRKYIKNNTPSNDYNNVIFLPKQSHMLDIDKNNTFAQYCINIIN